MTCFEDMPMMQEFINDIHVIPPYDFYAQIAGEVFGSWRAWNGSLAPLALRRYFSIVLPFRTIYVLFSIYHEIILLFPISLYN